MMKSNSTLSEPKRASFPLSRREFMLGSASAMAATVGTGVAVDRARAQTDPGELKLGLVTYLLARDWDIETIIKNCAETRFEGVELRSTHGHGVEVVLGPAERREVRLRFEDSPVTLASLGSAFEYHQTDPAELRRNIEGTKQYAQLAADVGAKGIKVRPNRLLDDQGIEPDATLRQIGKALHEVGEAAAGLGVEIRVEVHGRGTSLLSNMKAIMDHAAHDNVFVCWNSNPTDLAGDGLRANFLLVRDKIHFVHIHDLFDQAYPYRELFGLLKASGYRSYCCAEMPGSSDPLRVMRYYRALFESLRD